ncbi:MAG: AAA family ATPase [Blautia wexlerae]
MKLVAVALKNFRGYLQEHWVSFSDITTVVGRNDVGKSTILEALDIFFGVNVVKPEVTDKNVSTLDNYFQITCKFSDLPPQLVLDAQVTTSLSREYLLDADGCLQLQKRWICSTAKPKEEVRAVCQHPANEGLNDLVTLGNAALRKLAKERLIDTDYAAVNKASNPHMRATLWASEDVTPEETVVPLGEEDGGKVWSRLALHLPYFALFQSDRKSTERWRDSWTVGEQSILEGP